MIILKNDSWNSIIVTTQEKVVGTPSYYVLKLTDELTQDEILLIPIGDSSQWPERYNEFDIRIGAPSGMTASDSPVDGEILNIVDIGQWSYEIYPEYGTKPTTNPVTLGTWANLCESGRALIK